MHQGRLKMSEPEEPEQDFNHSFVDEDEVLKKLYPEGIKCFGDPGYIASKPLTLKEYNKLLGSYNKKIKTAYQNIERRFVFNLERVQNLIQIYQTLIKDKKNNIRYKKDILRAAVVMLHASLEDLLRGLLGWRLPSGNAEHLKSIPFNIGEGKDEKVSLPSLAKYRGQMIDKVIEDAVHKWLDKESYNNLGDVKSAIKALELEPGDFDTYFKSINAAMLRRHEIVHQTDRKKSEVGSHGKPTPLTASDVASWTKNTLKFGKAVLEKLKPPTKSPPPEAAISVLP
jgi:hypothetical protein